MSRALVAVALLLVLGPPVARADDGVGAFRIGGGASIFAWSDAHTTYAGMSPLHRQGWATGVLAASLPLNVAVLVAPWIAVGLLGRLSYGSSSLGVSGTVGGETARVDGQLLAYVEGSVRVDLARPFLRVAGGVTGTSTSGSGDTSDVLGTFAAYVGAHFFVDPAFSVSPHIGLRYDAGNGNTHTATVTTPLAYDYLEVFVGVELLGWIGGAPREHAR